MAEMQNLAQAFNPLQMIPLIQRQQGLDLEQQRLDLTDRHQAIQNQQMLMQMGKIAMDEKRNNLKEVIPQLPVGEAKLKAMNQMLSLGAGPNERPYQLSMDDLTVDGARWETALTKAGTPEATEAFKLLRASNPVLAKHLDDELRKNSAAKGFETLGKEAGLPAGPDVANALATSGPMQSKVGDTLIETRFERAKADQIETKNKAIMAQAAAVRLEARQLEGYRTDVTKDLSMSQAFTKELDALGKAESPEARAAIQATLEANNPQFKEYMASLPDLHFQAQQGVLKTRLGGMEARQSTQNWYDAPPDDETRTKTEALVSAFDTAIPLTEARQRYYENPTMETRKALETELQRVNAHVMNTLREKDMGLQAQRLELSKQMGQIASDRLQLSKNKDQRQADYDSNVVKAQADVLELGRDAKEADIARISRQYGVKVEDTIKALADPSKKGKLTIELPNTTRADAYEVINASDSALEMTGKLRGIVQQNPNVVGLQGAIQRMAAGATQQLEDLVGRDKDAARFLNTKPADKYEALQEILVFQVARSMNGRGVLTEPDVNAARRVVGTLKELGGSEQLLNKLEVIDEFVNSNKRRAQGLLQGGAKRLEGKGGAGEGAPQTAEDFLNLLGVQ